MLTFICLWCALVAAALPVGAAILRLAAADEIGRAGDRLVVCVWLGVAAISLALLAASLAAPLTTGVGLLVAGVLVAASCASRAARREALALARALKSHALAVTVWLAGAAVYSTQPVTWYDTGLYHFGAIRWLSQYGAVRGLALIQPRFGVASSWLALAAPFESGGLSQRTAALVGGFALLVGGAHALVCAARWLSGRGRASDRLMACGSALLFPVFFYWRIVASPSPDVPVAVLTLAAAWAVAAISESQAERANDEATGRRSDGATERRGDGTTARLGGGAHRVLNARVVPLLLSAYAVTIKMSALPLAVACALFYVAGGAGRVVRLRRAAFACAVAALFAAPVLAYQIVTSGCPLLPSSAGCADAPWSVGVEVARGFTKAVVQFGRWNGATKPAGAGALDWLWRGWSTYETTYRKTLFEAVVLAATGVALKLFAPARPAGRVLAWAGFAWLAFILIFCFGDLLLVSGVGLALAASRRGFPGKGWLLLIGLGGAALNLLVAPDLRFGMGYAVVLWSCFAAAPEETRRAHAPSAETTRRPPAAVHATFKSGAALAALLAASGVLLGVYRFDTEDVSPDSGRLVGIDAATGSDDFSVLLPPLMPRPYLKRVRLNDVEFYEPSAGNQCWAAPLPCTACADAQRDFFRVPADVMLRQPRRGLSAGFVRGVAPTGRADGQR